MFILTQFCIFVSSSQAKFAFFVSVAVSLFLLSVCRCHTTPFLFPSVMVQMRIRRPAGFMLHSAFLLSLFSSCATVMMWHHDSRCSSVQVTSNFLPRFLYEFVIVFIILFSYTLTSCLIVQSPVCRFPFADLFLSYLSLFYLPILSLESW